MRYSKFVLFFLILCLLCSCSKEKGVNPYLIPIDTNIIDVISESYTDLELEEISKFNGTIDELDAKYPIECARKIGEGEIVYQVFYLGEAKLAVVFFDNEEKSVFGEIYIAERLKTDFDGLTVKDSLQDVQQIDPNGEFLFLYTGIAEPRQSTHYTKDGYCILIEYDSNNFIMNISKELI